MGYRREPWSTSPPRGRRFAQAKLYLCTDARQRQGDLDDFLDAGLLPVASTSSSCARRAWRRWTSCDSSKCWPTVAERHGKLWAVNDRADIASPPAPRSCTSARTTCRSRWRATIVGDDVIDRPVDSFAGAVRCRGTPNRASTTWLPGPTWTTPTKPGRPAAGTSLLTHAAAVGVGGDRPWFAIGGIENLARLDEVIALGAARVVVVRAITEASRSGGGGSGVCRSAGGGVARPRSRS